jgi:O-antigen/teichoic acid export membrane protein
MALSGDKRSRVDSSTILTADEESTTALLPGSSVAGVNESAQGILKDEFLELSKLLKNSGVYALSSIMVPLITLGITPFLTHKLSTSDYGALVLLNTIIGLATGITQMGLGSAFFRSYNYAYTEPHEKRCVVATATFLLCIISVLIMIGAFIAAPFFTQRIFGHTTLSRLILIAGCVICVQNLAVPGLAWLRAESRAFLYSLLSIGTMLATLLANIVLVGILNWGLEGAFIATGVGYICLVVCTLGIVIFHAGIRIRVDIAWNLLGFGLPLIVSFVSYWILQLSDRYLLSLLGSLTETAKYSVAYTLGTALTVVVIGPFTLAWPATMFTIAKRKDAAHIFQLVFRWLGLFLLLAAFLLSLLGKLILDWFFPVAYRSVGFVIPIVAISIVFYGMYYVLMVGSNVKGRSWMNSIFTLLAAIVNVIMNLVLIPHYGAMGAAVATLVGYIVLALAAYIANQKIYPIPFEVGRFVIALLLGVALYAVSSVLAQSQGIYPMCALYSGALLLYSGCLAVLVRFPMSDPQRIRYF